MSVRVDELVAGIGADEMLLKVCLLCVVVCLFLCELSCVFVVGESAYRA
jgi:hypothetical protein